MIEPPPKKNQKFCNINFKMSIQKNLWYIFNKYWKVYNMVADMKLMSTIQRHGYAHAAMYQCPHTTM